MNNKKNPKKMQLPIGRNSADKEKGVALLFTLGFLALLLVLALAFATTSITQKKMAGNNNDVVYAKMLAESAVQRVIGVLQSYDEGAQYSHCDNTTHPTATAPFESIKNHATLDWLYKLGTANAFYWYDSYATTANINWEYVKQYDSDAKTKKITGRVAYVVIPGGGLDPVKLVKTGVDEGNNYPESRKGIEMNEINIKSLDGNNSVFGATSPFSDVTKFSYAAGGGLLSPASPNGTWADFENMFSLMSITDSNKKNTIRDWFVLNTQPEAEAFWRDNGNSKIDFNILYPSTINTAIDELFHRFNLTRFTDTNANGVYDPAEPTITLNDIIPNIITGAGTWPTNSDVYVKPSSPVVYNGSCIPWIENWKDAGTFTDPDGVLPLTAANARARQIAANLKDYCDSDSIPTTDLLNATPVDPPTYTGNEITPYINELGVFLQASAHVQETFGGFKRKFDYSINYAISVELINIYGADVSDFPAAISVAGSMTYTYSVPWGPAITVTDAISTSTPINFTPSLGVSGYSMSTWLQGAGSSSLTRSAENWPLSTFNASLTNVYINITSVRLDYNGFFADFSKIGVSKVISTLVEQNGTGGPTNADGYFSYEADDPRQNLNTGDWPEAGKNKSEKAGLVGASYCGTTAAVNSNITCTSAGDAEPGSTPTTISTAYIRNAPMESLWELGAVHRAGQWETINLKKYNSTEGVLATGGGNAYADGDANILDQVKLTPNTTSDKKLNLKLHKDSVLYSLFHKVKLGDAYATFSGGTELTSTKIWNVASASPDSTTLVYQLKEKNINFYSRGCLAEVTRLFDGTCGTQSNDRQKEEIIGKVINLTGISVSDYFTIIVLAQTIKDIGGGITISKDLDMNGTIGTASEVVLHSDINGNNNATNTGISETITSCAFGAYDQYADEILAEQKIKAEIYRDPATKRIKILRYEYIEE
jgi:hypothetical protein